MGAYGDQERGMAGVKRRANFLDFLDRDIRMYILEVWG
jgi:hypothetical protein